MSGYIYSVQGTKALAAATTQTLIEIKPASAVPVQVKQWSVSFDGSSPAAGIRVQLIRQSTDGTGTASPPTPQKAMPFVDRAAQSTILWNLTAEGTLDAVLETYYVSPFAGLLLVQYPMGQEPWGLEGGNRIAIRVITPAAVSPNADYCVWFEEG